MKAHRFRGKHTSREEVARRFKSELYSRIDAEIWKRVGKENGVLAFEDYKTEHGELIRIEQKLKLLDEWYDAGKNTAFNSEPIGYLLEAKRNLQRRKQ